MSKNRSACVSSTWTSEDTTVSTGPAYFHGVISLGSAASSTITILDGSSIKFAIVAATTANAGLFLSTPVVFSTSLVIDITGTASYAVQYSKCIS